MDAPADLALSSHAARNRAQWDEWASDYVDAGRRHWATNEATWGMWEVPERELEIFGGIERFAGSDVLEAGCGTAYVSSWLARAGARVTGIDISPGQLATARELRREHGLEDAIDLREASAEAMPVPDASIDLVVSEYGASIWADPYAWIPEAARVLRPGGELIFLVNGLLAMLCIDEPGLATTRQLHRPLFGLHRMEWPDDDSVEFHLPHGEWIRLLRQHGLQVERLVELQAPVGATTRYRHVDPEWSHHWPSEEIWVARKVR